MRLSRASMSLRWPSRAAAGVDGQLVSCIIDQLCQSVTTWPLLFNNQ